MDKSVTLLEEIRDEKGALIKLKAPLSTWKSITIREWQNVPYLHINDVSKCWSKDKSCESHHFFSM